MPTVADLVAALDRAYPPSLAESWDSGIGLTCGDPTADVRTVLLAVDVDPRTVAEAVAVDAQVLVTHHPLLFRAVQSVSAGSPKGALIHRMIRGGVAHIAAHTNADRAPGGVNDALAEALGLTDVEPLQVAPEPALDKLVVFVPADHTARLIDALAAAGAGRVGDYSHAAFVGDGIGQFLPLTGANPTIGEIGRLARVAEQRVDMVLPRSARRAVLSALRATHPYEEPGFDLTEIAAIPSRTTGLGRIGTLPQAMTAADFARYVSAALPATVTGARLAGDPGRLVRRVAVCGGAGGSLLGALGAVDAFVTADLTHHIAAEFVAEPGRPVLVEVAHWASEWPWLGAAARVLGAALGESARVIVSTARTDPWTLCVR